MHIVNNVIRENTATYGGGIVIEDADSSRIESNTIENNVVTQGGGGIDVYLNARPTISHNIIRNNSARMGGGIMSESGSLPRVTETVIQGNSADPTGGGKGGAIACFSASVVLENCLITGNNSSDYAISGINSAATRIVNCTIADNSSAGIGRFNTAWSFSVEVKNSILRNAGAEIDSGTVATISYSDVEGGYTGAGNIDADPRFVDPPADYRLAPASPCIDAGAADTTVVSDLDGVARPVGSGWDMGAYESTVVTPPDITAPAVQITSPSSGAVVSGDVAITAAATDEQSGIARVEFRVDGALISSSTAEPYAATWDASAAAAGSHTIQVTAYDGAGNSASASGTVTIPAPDTTPPTVSIMVPDDGTVVSGIVWFGAGAGDTGSGISRVEFRADGDLFYTAWGGYMYIADWDSTGAAPGPHVIEVTAYDIAGNSASTSITVVTLDTTAPVVSITSPNDSAVVAGRVSITAAAADADSDIVRVDFAVDGATTASDTTSPYSADWNATGAAVGDHIISATAYDGAGNSAVATCTVSVAAKQLKKPKRDARHGNHACGSIQHEDVQGAPAHRNGLTGRTGHGQDHDAAQGRHEVEERGARPRQRAQRQVHLQSQTQAQGKLAVRRELLGRRGRRRHLRSIEKCNEAREGEVDRRRRSPSALPLAAPRTAAPSRACRSRSTRAGPRRRPRTPRR